MATREDVARRAGVSSATVSRVMNGSEHVSPAVKQRVLQCARELSYQPNLLAKGLKTRQNYHIAYIVPDVTNPYYTETYRGILRHILPLSYTCSLTEMAPHSPLHELQLSRFDGVILAVQPREELLHSLESSNIPFVLQTQEQDTMQKAVSVSHELSPALEEALEYMAQKGHRQFALLLNGAGSPGTAETYTRALHSQGLQMVTAVYTDYHKYPYHYIAGFQAAKDLLAQNRSVTVVLAENDLLAIGAMAAALEQGLLIPEDIAFLGCDDTVAAQFSYPPLSTIKRFKENQGMLSAKLLLALIKGEKAESHCFQTKFIKRASI